VSLWEQTLACFRRQRLQLADLVQKGLYHELCFPQRWKVGESADDEACDSREWVVQLPAARRPTTSDPLVQ
jgi:hypothetical protein